MVFTHVRSWSLALAQPPVAPRIRRKVVWE